MKRDGTVALALGQVRLTLLGMVVLFLTQPIGTQVDQRMTQELV